MRKYGFILCIAVLIAILSASAYAIAHFDRNAVNGHARVSKIVGSVTPLCVKSDSTSCCECCSSCQQNKDCKCCDDCKCSNESDCCKDCKCCTDSKCKSGCCNTKPGCSG